MDVRPGGSPLVEPILITRWIRLEEGVPATDEELNMSGEPAKPWPQPVSNSLWRSRYQLYHRRQWFLSIRKKLDVFSPSMTSFGRLRCLRLPRSWPRQANSVVLILLSSAALLPNLPRSARHGVRQSRRCTQYRPAACPHRSLRDREC